MHAVRAYICIASEIKGACAEVLCSLLIVCAGVWCYYCCSEGQKKGTESFKSDVKESVKECPSTTCSALINEVKECYRKFMTWCKNNKVLTILLLIPVAVFNPVLIVTVSIVFILLLFTLLFICCCCCPCVCFFIVHNFDE